MEKIKSLSMYAGKLVLSLVIIAIILNFFGVNFLSLIADPVGTVKGLFSKKSATAAIIGTFLAFSLSGGQLLC